MTAVNKATLPNTSSRDSKPSASTNFLAISLVVTTADIGCPFPIGFPIVTMSGHTPVWKAGEDITCSLADLTLSPVHSYTLWFIDPKVVPSPSKPGLHFIKNTQSSSCVHVAESQEEQSSNSVALYPDWPAPQLCACSRKSEEQSGFAEHYIRFQRSIPSFCGR